MIIYVIAPKVPENVRELIIHKDKFIIAVDQAVEALNKAKFKYDFAIGDFDSLSNKALIQSEYLTLNPIKDESDTYKAIEYAYQKSNDVILIGGLLGNRLDHLYANILLLQRFPELIIQDHNNKITLKRKGIYSYMKNEYDYISIFAIEDAIITLKGTKYLLHNYKLKKDNPIGLSNEVLDNATIEVNEGVIIVFESKD